MALFGMKLRTINIVSAICTDKFMAVASSSNDIVLITALRVVRMHEVKSLRWRRLLDQWIGSLHLNLIPTHMRYFQTIFLWKGKLHEAGIYEAKTRDIIVPLFTSLRQQLHAETYSQDWYLLFEHLAPDGLNKFEAMERFHSNTESTDSGQQECFCVVDILDARR